MMATGYWVAYYCSHGSRYCSKYQTSFEFFSTYGLSENVSTIATSAKKSSSSVGFALGASSLGPDEHDD
jgi:predicted butyrate kinase (DUF1464 family)